MRPEQLVSAVRQAAGTRGLVAPAAQVSEPAVRLALPQQARAAPPVWAAVERPDAAGVVAAAALWESREIRRLKRVRPAASEAVRRPGVRRGAVVRAASREPERRVQLVARTAQASASRRLPGRRAPAERQALAETPAVGAPSVSAALLVRPASEPQERDAAAPLVPGARAVPVERRELWARRRAPPLAWGSRASARCRSSPVRVSAHRG